MSDDKKGTVRERPNGYRTFTDEVELDTLNTMTLEDAIEAIGFGKFQLKIMIILGLSWVIDGMEMWMVAMLGIVLKCTWQLSPLQETLLSTAIFTGYACGATILGYLSDIYGRRMIIIIGCIWCSFYGLLAAASPNYTWIVVLRMLVGIGVGGTPVATIFYAEISPIRIRGVLVELCQLFFALGSSLQVVAALLLLQPFGWRVWVAASSVPSLLFVFSSRFLPESPRYLVAAGRPEEALKVLEEMARDNGVKLPGEKLVLDNPLTQPAQVGELFKPERRRTTFLLMVIWFTFGLYYYGIGFTSATLLELHGDCSSYKMPWASSSDSRMCGLTCSTFTTKDYIELLITSLAEAPGVIIVALLIDKVGRRPVMCVGSACATLLLFILVFCPGRIVTIVILFSLRGVTSGIGQIAYVYTSEVYPTGVRSIALGFGVSLARVGTMVTPFIGQLLLRHSLVQGIVVYMVVLAVNGLCAFFLPTETRHKPMP